MSVVTKFAKQMRKLRLAQHKTWASLSVQTGIHATTLATIEKDARDLRLSNFVKICEALDTTPCDMLSKVAN